MGDVVIRIYSRKKLRQIKIIIYLIMHLSSSYSSHYTKRKIKEFQVRQFKNFKTNIYITLSRKVWYNNAMTN